MLLKPFSWYEPKLDPVMGYGKHNIISSPILVILDCPWYAIQSLQLTGTVFGAVNSINWLGKINDRCPTFKIMALSISTVIIPLHVQ